MLLPLMALEHPNAADGLPSLRGYAQQAAADAAAAAPKQGEQEAEEANAQEWAAEGEAAPQAGVLYAGASAVELDADAALLQAEPDAAAAEAAPAVAAATVAEAAAAADGALPSGDVALQQHKQQQSGQQRAAAAAAVAEALAGRDGPAFSALQTPLEAPTVEQELQQLQSSSLEELPGEPSLSLFAAVQPDAANEAAMCRRDCRPASVKASLHADAAAAEVGSPPASLDFNTAGRSRSAAAAWDAAILQEGPPAPEAPTPRLASQQWQQPPAPSPLAAGLGLGSGQQQGEGGPATGAAPDVPLGVGPPRPALQLKLSASRSLDPDFTTSAQHTGFGESPASALPDYGSIRRTLSGRSDASGGSAAGAVHAPGSARSTQDTVGEAISRSLASLRRQNSSLKQQQAAEAAAHAGHVLAQQAQQARQPQTGSGSRVGSAAGSPGQEGAEVGPAADPRRLRQPGSFKEQAGKPCCDCSVLLQCRFCSGQKPCGAATRARVCGFCCLIGRLSPCPGPLLQGSSSIA